MKQNFPTVCILLFAMIGCHLRAFSQQSLPIDRVRFDNEIEKSILNATDLQHQHPLDYFLMMGPDADEALLKRGNQFIAQIVDEVKEPLAKKKTFTKQMEYLQEVLHTKYLKKYQLIANFGELIDTGTYNCLTGTALYALVLQALGIEVQIYAKPNHVYLTAGTEHTMIESTAPTEGVFTPDQRFQKALLNSLLASKLITKEEILANGEQVVFANAILPDVKIDIRQLAGLQYRNDALQAVQSTNWGAANKQYLKSYLLYADPAVMTMIAITGILNLSLGNIVGIDRIKESIFILENCPKMIARERLHLMLEEEVEVYANAHYGENDWNQLQILLDPYHDDTLIYEQAQYRILGQRYDAAQRNKEYDKCAGMAKELYKIKPWSPQVQSCLIDNFLHHFKGNNDFQAVLDSMDRFAIKYPFAPTDDSFHTAYMMFLLGIAGGKFESDECKKAEISIQRFEAFQSQKAGTDMSEIIGGAYAAGVRAYFRIPDYKNARRCLERGMALAPYSRDISSCKRSFGKELGLDPE